MVFCFCVQHSAFVLCRPLSQHYCSCAFCTTCDVYLQRRERERERESVCVCVCMCVYVCACACACVCVCVCVYVCNAIKLPLLGGPFTTPKCESDPHLSVHYHTCCFMYTAIAVQRAMPNPPGALLAAHHTVYVCGRS